MTKRINDRHRMSVNFVFFGTPQLAVSVLDELEKEGLLPGLVVTGPDEKQGRGLKLTPPPVKTWALERNIDVLQPISLDQDFRSDLEARSSRLGANVFVVVAYGEIFEEKVLALPKRGVLNVHPSLLPRLRGPSPIRSAILNDEKKTGVSIIKLDEEMDHGPIVAQKAVPIEDWPPRAPVLEEILMREGGRLLARILPEWVAGRIEAYEQNHDIATYCEKIEKEDGLLDLAADPYKKLLKIRAYEGWPGTYSFYKRGEKKIRVQILDAHLETGKLVIDTVKPEGKKVMPYEDFLLSGATPI